MVGIKTAEAVAPSVVVFHGTLASLFYSLNQKVKELHILVEDVNSIKGIRSPDNGSKAGYCVNCLNTELSPLLRLRRARAVKS